ncbi:Phosphoglucomutase-2 [Apiotrichum porosum]|uniref:phosphoglucomutase (alpha-D-glucose-1,6-bisphosphate-dependent) n=1 Tax=Apiotrichum porosum TaxID=105984 RepID=A0A427XSV9_9TREE|nr:Phosphoglucomutase-2 [Apiotrichum porosum]RSH81905.1 Phosphoglucomutase-2 [Apiotrichum porosum]
MLPSGQQQACTALSYPLLSRPFSLPAFKMSVVTVPTTPFSGQKPGTSGLRKKVKVFQQKNYTENFIQATFTAMPGGSEGTTIVVGGDGRFYSPEVSQTILRLAAGNGVKHVVIGQDTILSTPAVSALVRSLKADGAILLTASHNPGGPENDFGIKFNISNGGPAPEDVTNKIYAVTEDIKEYKTVELPDLDLSKTGEFTHGPLKVTIVDSVSNYLQLLQEIFDFDMIKKWLHETSPKPSVLFDALNGVTGPYGRAIFVEALGLPESSIQNCTPLPDFGGLHPDPNLTYAHTLVERVEKENIEFGAASDGDGDRNMIYGKGAFVTPSDSVAIIADWAEEAIPYFKGGVKGLARSMPTSGAIDIVAKARGLECFEVPTGWKFFGNLMDAGRLSICGEESFGTGSDHIREKDGVWAVVAWMSILAKANQTKPGTDINAILLAHYKKYGRSFFSRYDYEEVASEGAEAMMAHLRETFASSSFAGSAHKATSSDASFTVAAADDFAYTDPIDGSVSTKQGLRIMFTDGSRIIFRLSGTGSSGATVRLYVEKYSRNEAEYADDAQVGLKPLIEVALQLSKLQEYTKRDKPNVIT